MALRLARVKGTGKTPNTDEKQHKTSAQFCDIGVLKSNKLLLEKHANVYPYYWAVGVGVLITSTQQSPLEAAAPRTQVQPC
eukprot:m.361614 g.361614  ORF g.361614 m.361614 type:complete len:81 (-) comp19723_c0_seq1:2700-2942(-)